MRILDLTIALAGPFCTMLLGDLGADIVKIESAEGDLPRFGGPFMKEDTERAYGGYFASINRNKRGIVLDLKSPMGREAVLRLVDRSDVIVENFRTGVMDPPRPELGGAARAQPQARLRRHPRLR